MIFFFFFPVSKESWPMLRLLKYFLSESAASPLECLTDNSGDVSRSIYSNLCLDRKNGYQHVCPHLDADSQGRLSCPPAPLGAMTDSLQPLLLSHVSSEEFGILSFFTFFLNFPFL